MADEPNQQIPIDPHAVPDEDPAGIAAAQNPVVIETGTREAAATRSVTSAAERPVPAPPVPAPAAPAAAPVPDHAEHASDAETDVSAPQHAAAEPPAPKHAESLAPKDTGPAAPQHNEPSAPKHAEPEHQDHQRLSSKNATDAQDKPPIPLWYALKRALRGFISNQLTNQAAALTYYAVLAVAPTLVALVSILGVVRIDGNDIVQKVLDIAESVGSEDAIETIKPILTQVAESPKAGIALIIGVLLALWSASSYVTAFSRASNRIYGVTEGRPYWKLRPAMYLVTFTLVVIVAIAAVLLVASGSVAVNLGELIGLSAAIVKTWQIAKWPVVLLLALVAIAMLYRLTPNVRQRKFQLISWGAGVAIVTWILASVGFGFYVSTAGNYGATYGALAGVIVFLLWVWISNLALLFGAQLDAELERGRQLRSGIIAEEEIQLRRRDTSASEKKAAKRRKVVQEGRDIRVNLTSANEIESDSTNTK